MTRSLAPAFGLFLAFIYSVAAEPPAVKTPGGDKPPTAQQIEQQAQQCYTAKISLLLYQVFLADESVPADAKEAARRRLPFWEDAADKDLVRLGKKWVTRGEAQKARDDAEALVNQGLDLLKLKNNDLAKEKFEKASDANPNSGRADYLMGLIYASLGRNFAKAQTHFKECINREPDNVCALNNLALVEVFLSDHKNALKHFQAAVAISPNIAEIGHNLGRVLAQAGEGRIVIPGPVRAGYADLYDAVLKQLGTPVQKGVQWLYMVPLASADDKTQDPTDTVITGGGTGFVVHPQYVLTNRDVVGRARSFLIDDPIDATSKNLVATLVAQDDATDLALLRCENLAAPPAMISTDGTSDQGEVLVLGFPKLTLLGANLSSSRATNWGFNLRVHDADANFGKGGGPVCDNRGEVLAVLGALYNSRGMDYPAIPIGRALPLIQKHIPNYQAQSSERNLLDWPQVDALARKSTVLILRQESKSAKLTMGGHVHTDWIEDRLCLACRGSGRRDCQNRGCNKGWITTFEVVKVAEDPVTGTPIYQKQKKRVRCPVCDGKGNLDCPFCKEGVSKD